MVMVAAEQTGFSSGAPNDDDDDDAMYALLRGESAIKIF